MIYSSMARVCQLKTQQKEIVEKRIIYDIKRDRRVVENNNLD